VKPEEIRHAIQDFLDLIERGFGSTAENEERLPLILDRLALAHHFTEAEYDGADYPDPPKRDYQVLRARGLSRFPDYGYYNLSDPITQDIGAGPCLIRDAIDDLADIAGDLEAIAWRWRHTSPADALWHFRMSYVHHWRAHLRGLQLYLDACESER